MNIAQRLRSKGPKTLFNLSLSPVSIVAVQGIYGLELSIRDVYTPGPPVYAATVMDPTKVAKVLKSWGYHPNSVAWF